MAARKVEKMAEIPSNGPTTVSEHSSEITSIRLKQQMSRGSHEVRGGKPRRLRVLLPWHEESQKGVDTPRTSCRSARPLAAPSERIELRGPPGRFFFNPVNARPDSQRQTGWRINPLPHNRFRIGGTGSRSRARRLYPKSTPLCTTCGQGRFRH
jgi:hypothetical protein